MHREQITTFERVTGLEIRYNPDTLDWFTLPATRGVAVDDDPRKHRYWFEDGVKP